MKKIKNEFVILITLMIIGIGCNNSSSIPMPNDEAHVLIESNHKIFIKSYTIPKGIFRGVLWPKSKQAFFQIWITIGNNDVFYDISVPDEVIPYNKDITGKWSFTPQKKHTIQQFLAKKKNSSKRVQLILPKRKVPFVFRVLENGNGDEMIIFMNIAEKIIHEGLFGYILIKST